MQKNRTVLVILALMVSGWSYAQEYKVARSSGRLELHVGRVTVEGYNGNEIVFSSKDGDDEKDERGKGLQVINGLGLNDNTGLGINVAEKNGTVEVYQLNRNNAPDIRVRVPKGVIVAFQHESQYGGEAVF